MTSTPRKVKAPVSTAPVTRRLHISGLAPTVTAQAVVDRFASFGQVVGGVQGLDGLDIDANGVRKSFAFLNLVTTEAQLNKCISLLSGSMWKGHKLRIAPARPDFRQRLEAERAAATAAESDEAASKTGKKKRRRNPDPDVGYTAHHFELVDATNLERHRGWTLDASTGKPSPLFPLIIRPSHPIFPPSKPAPTSWTRETPKARMAREARIKTALERPVLRAKRMRIDPRKWGRTKVLFPENEDRALGGLMGAGAIGYWECEEAEGVEKEGVVRWVYKAPDGSVRRTEMIKLGARQVEHTDRFTALLEGLNRPLKPTTEEEPILEDGFEATEQASEEEDEEGDANEDDRPRKKRVKSLSPPPYIPAAPRSLLYNDEDTFALLSTTRAEDELLEARRLEKEAQIKVLQALLSGEQPALIEKSEAEQVPAKKLPKVEGFADEDDDEDWGDVMRLRGGAKDEDKGDSSDDSDDDSSDSDEDSDSDENDSEEGEDSSVTVAADNSSVEPEAPDPPPTTTEERTKLERGMLKEMFKPKEGEASFSLLDGLDLELEELERTPSPPPAAIQTLAAPRRGAFIPPPALGRTNRAWVGTGPTSSLFPFPFGSFEDRATGEINEAEVASIGMTMERAEELKRESDRFLRETGGDFWRSETTEEIEEAHQKLRDKLRGFARKRHREAVKRQGKKPRMTRD